MRCLKISNPNACTLVVDTCIFESSPNSTIRNCLRRYHMWKYEVVVSAFPRMHLVTTIHCPGMRAQSACWRVCSRVIPVFDLPRLSTLPFLVMMI